jgi:RNA polymerase sigma-70 factor (ECF subfamily)
MSRTDSELSAAVDDDREIMLRYAAGDLAAFDLLFERWAARLNAFFRRSFGTAVEADDLTERMFLRVHRERRTFGAEDHVREWLFAIAARLRQEELRRRRGLAIADEELLAGEEEREIVPEPGRVRPQMQTALDGLPESQRVVIHLHRYERMNFAEIAAVLGTTEDSVKRRAFRAYERLGALLAAPESGIPLSRGRC